MLSFEELKELTARVTWAPGTRFSVHMDRHEGPVLILEGSVPDAMSDGKIDLRIATYIPPINTPNGYYDWLLYRLNRIAVHESCEWFKIDGKNWVNPHEPKEFSH